MFVFLYHSSLVENSLMSKQRQRGCVNVSQIKQCIITAINSLLYFPISLCSR